MKMFDSDSISNNPKSSILKRLKGQGVGAVVARGASGSFGVMLLGAAMAFGTNMLLARVMGLSQYGIYIYALTWINVLLLLCKLGMDTSLLRFVAAYNANKEWGLLRGIIKQSVKYIFIASLIVGTIAAGVVWLLQDNLESGQDTTFWVAFLLLPILALTGLRHSALRAFKHVIQAALPESFFRPLTIVILASIAYFLSQESIPAAQVMTFNLVGALVAFYIGTRWLIKILPEQLHDISPIYRNQEWVKVSLPLFFMSGMYLILHQTDIIMVGAILDTEQAGVYAVATRVARLVGFGLGAVNAIAAPMISELYSTHNHQLLQRMVTLSARGIFLFTIIISIGLAFSGQIILGLFGEEFVNGYEPMLVLLLGQIINALAGSVGFLMTMTGFQKQAAIIVGLSAVTNIILNAILISNLGVMGAAISTAITTAMWNIIMLTFVWRRLNINPTVLARIQT